MRDGFDRVNGKRVGSAGGVATGMNGLDVYTSDAFDLPLPPGHKFPMAKYRRLRERLEASPQADRFRLQRPVPADDEELALAHTADYVQRVAAGALTPLEQRRIGFPWSPQLVVRSRYSVGASIDAAIAAIRRGVGVNLAGGTHHAFADSGQGYCVFNDVAVAARWMLRYASLDSILVVDLDVHQGNGTAFIFRNEPRVFTLSIHCGENFPYRKTDGDLDVSLPAGMGDDDYLTILRSALDEALSRARPQLVFYLAGADAYEGDRFGKLRLSQAGLARRDELVFDGCAAAGAAAAVSMAGGYAENLDDLVEIHATTVDRARRLIRPALELPVDFACCPAVRRRGVEGDPKSRFAPATAAAATKENRRRIKHG